MFLKHKQSEHMCQQFYFLGISSRYKTNVHTRLIHTFLRKKCYLGMMVHFYPSTKKVDLFEFEVSLIYIENSRISRATQRDLALANKRTSKRKQCLLFITVSKVEKPKHLSNDE